MMHDELVALLGAAAVVGPEADQDIYITEWRDRVRGSAAAIVCPESTTDVAKLVRFCAERGYTLVAQGGNTGLCGGAIPDDGERAVLLSMRRMDKVLAVDADDNSMLVEAGCTLASAQAAAGDANRYFPLSIAAEGSATIGGNISTNAGGIHVLRYGTARDLVLGLEVVLADGTVWNGLRRLRKNTAGYDLKQVFIGSEGTLGIVTRAVLKLFPRPAHYVTACAAVNNIGEALALYHRLADELPGITHAFELVSARALEFVLRHIPGTRAPLDTETPYFVLAEFASGPNLSIDDEVMAALSRAMEDGAVSDVALATSLTQRDDFWRVRHSISEAQKFEGASLKHDIAVPLSRMAAFHDEAEAALARLCPGVRPCIFGHIGDGNLHYNISRPVAMTDADFAPLRDAISEAIYERVAAHEGTISAEHGIGSFKRELLAAHASDSDMALMATLKRAFDPATRLNPGKVLATAQSGPDETSR